METNDWILLGLCLWASGATLLCFVLARAVTRLSKVVAMLMIGIQDIANGEAELFKRADDTIGIRRIKDE